MINRVVKSEDLEKETEELVQQITRYSAKVVHIGKEAFYKQVDMSFEEAISFGTQVMLNNFEEPDTSEGVQAFVEKRDPKW